MTQPGAPAALQGYRLQALYALRRIFASAADGTQVFCPEGKEDLDIQDQTGQLVEVLQVKSYSSLALSDLEPEKADSFFHRVSNLLRAVIPPIIKLVNFGAIGPELWQAWEGSEKQRKRIITKLTEKGFQKTDVEEFFDHVQLVSLDANQEREAVLSQIQNLSTGIDPQNAFDLFVAWYYRLAEQRQTVTCVELIDKINTVGHFLAEQYNYHQQWYTTIEPLEVALITDEHFAKLHDEFYAGVQARYEHIVAGLDFRREHKMAEITRAFQQNNVVIIHAASGQGKSTLAYRYLHDTYPEKWRFVVKRVQDVEHAQSIALALSGFASAVQIPMAVYVDVHPQDYEWTELVKRLTQQPYLEILVTVREEDYRRANIAGAGLNFTDVELGFNQQEAQLIYERARSAVEHWDFLDFDAAWDQFEAPGPLMEFVYLLTQTQTLRQRLQGQIQRIQEDIRMGASADELRLLCLVSVASAYGARLSTRDLIDNLKLPSPDRTLAQFEKEYLLRRSADGFYLEGLHPIRSSLLSELLVKPDLNPWIEIATQVLPLMLEGDLETFILHALVERPADSERLLNLVMTLKPHTWSGIAGVLRCLLWAGVNDYVVTNCAATEAAYKVLGPAWWAVVDFNFSPPGEGPEVGEWWTKLGELISSEQQTQIRAIRQSQTSKDSVFQRAIAWFEKLDQGPTMSSTPEIWRDVAEVLYWAGRLVSRHPIVERLSAAELNVVSEELSLTMLADLSLALHLYNPQRHQMWLETHTPTIHRRLAHESNILALEKVGTTLKIHFIPIGEASGDSTDRLHNETMAKIDLIRRLFPTFEHYAAQGYGFKPAGIELPQGDSARKDGVSVNYLPPKWSPWLNSVASGLARYFYRPESWKAYLDIIIEIRQLIVNCITQLNRGLVKFYQRDKALSIGQKYIDLQVWQRCWDMLRSTLDLPKSSVDPWGFASESATVSFLQTLSQQGSGPNTTSQKNKAYVPTAIALQKYKAYLEAQRDYFGSMRNFVGQAPNIWVTDFNIGKLHPDDPRRATVLKELQDKGVKTDPHLPVLNLFDARTRITTYQQQFRALFGQLLDVSLITTLEQREHEELTTAWMLWYFYSYEPWKGAANPLIQVAHWVRMAQNQLISQIQQALTTVQSPTCTAIYLDIEHRWQGRSALWVRFDLRDPTELYTQILQQFPAALCETLGIIDFESLIYYLIQDTCEYIVVIPVVGGKMLNELVWPLYTITILQRDTIQKKPWAYFSQELPDTIRKELQLGVWDSAEITLANQLSESVNTLRQLTSQISEFQAMPDPTEPGGEKLQEYIGGEVSRTLSAALQIFFDAAAALLDKFNALSAQEQQKRDKLCKTVEALLEVHTQIRPGEGDGIFNLDLAGIVEYAQRLEKIYPGIEGMRLFWIADILEQI